MGKIVGYLRLMRPVNCLMVGFAVVVGAVIVGPNISNALWLTLTYSFVTGFALTAEAMIINDYYDREIDAINEPGRPIPSGLVYPHEALVLAFALTVIGLTAAYLAYPSSLAIAIFAWIVFVIYTTIGKRSGLPGNFLVSICVAIPFIFGSYTAVGSIEPNVMIVSIIAFLSNTGREITKGIVDVEGDRAKNIRTVAVRYGEKAAAVVAVLFLLSAILLSPIPLVLNFVSLWFIPLVAITDFGLGVSSFMLLKDHSRENARKIKKIILLSFLVALLAFVAGAAK
ncbi:MAG: UbiA family prenyltransferase [Candidatus Bathyarchaeota archaeon]|nr:MAG: UbiA family prenyltransferase [Candidatus Bathyarchaeota archaeon]